MRPVVASLLSAALVLCHVSRTQAVFADEVGDIDFHHALLGLPQRDTTFFHRPRRDVAATLLYTVSDLGVVGAVSPKNGTLRWRHALPFSGNGKPARTGPKSYHLRAAAEGEGWLASGAGSEVAAWDAWSGRSAWRVTFPGSVQDLEILALTASGGSDLLVLHSDAEDDDGTRTMGRGVLRRLDGKTGRVLWEAHGEHDDAALLQVSTSGERVFVASLHGAVGGGYTLRLAVLDPGTGRKLDDLVIGGRGEVRSPDDVVLVGANSAAPIVAWTDAAKTVLRVTVLGATATTGLGKKLEFPLPGNTVTVQIHAPTLMQSQPHFLVHSITKDDQHKADVFHVDLKAGAVTKAYELALLPGHGAFSTSSDGANVYFTRITGDEITLVSSESDAALGRWPVKGSGQLAAVHAVSEVLKKAKDTYAVRTAALTSEEDWVLVQSGEVAWSRPEGLSGTVAAAYAEFPASEETARALVAEAHASILQAYVHRVSRHFRELQHLPAYLESILRRLLASILGQDVAATATGDDNARDSFGLHKLAILATRRGRVYGLDVGHQGRIVWSRSAFTFPPGSPAWDVKGMLVDDERGHVTIMGASGEVIVLTTDTGRIAKRLPVGSRPKIQAAVAVDSQNGRYLLPVAIRDNGGALDDLPAAWTPSQTIVVRAAGGNAVEGLTFIPDGQKAHPVSVWTFTPPGPGQNIVTFATRSPHEPIASIGRILGNRAVRYKYLNPDSMVVAAIDSAKKVLSVYLIDTVSGQVLVSSAYEGVDPSKEVSCAISENFYTCSFFGSYSVLEGQVQTLKGYQIMVTDLYEAETPNDRGPLGSRANYSSVSPIDDPTGPVLPSIETQSWILSGPVRALSVSQTRQGITSKMLLAYLPETHAVIGIPRGILEPRRPVGREPTAAEQEEGLMRYTPVVELDARSIISHELDVLGIERIITSPTTLESTSLVLSYGLDVFGTRVTPSLPFDLLGKGFNKVTLITTVVGLFAGVLALKPMVSPS